MRKVEVNKRFCERWGVGWVGDGGVGGGWGRWSGGWGFCCELLEK